jgi:hypothetical protein
MSRLGLSSIQRGCFLFLLVLIGGGCARSPGFHRDQEYAQDVESYYNKRGAPGTSTQRIEKMGQPRKRVLVLDFWNDTPVKTDGLGALTAKELRRILEVSQRVIIPTDETKLRTEDFVSGEKVNVAQLVREGRKLGVSVIVVGRITKIAFRQRGDEVGLLRQKQTLAGADIEVKVFDITAGRELSGFMRSGEASNNKLVAFEGNADESAEFRSEMTELALRDAATLAKNEILKVVEKLTWEGRIARVATGKIYVNAGRKAGLIPGDILKVITQGEDIHDPSTGAFLGRAQGQVKGTLEVLDFIGPDGAVTQIHTGANFQEGDLVQLY